MREPARQCFNVHSREEIANMPDPDSKTLERSSMFVSRVLRSSFLIPLAVLAACYSVDTAPFEEVDAGVDAMPDAGPDAPVEDPAQLATTQAPHDFGDVTEGETSGLLPVTIRNSGGSTSSAIAVALVGTDPAHFEIVPTGDATDCADATLEPDTTCTVQVRFAPQSAGARSAELEVSATDGGTVTVDLSGNGLSPGDLEITAGGTLAFGTIEIQSMSGTQTVTVRNNGGSPTAALETILGDTTNYTITSDACGGSPLGAGASCNVVVRFDPTAVGSLPTQVSVRESPVVGVSASASGTGSARIQVSKTGTGSITSAPAGISCGDGCTGSTVSFTQTPVTLTAAAGAGFAFDGWTGACASANPVPMCQLALTVPLTSAGATFVQVFTMSVTTSGSGTVTASPPGILCGNDNTDCSEVYETGTMVTLTAEPDPGWDVYSWSGTGATCNAGSTMCVVSMTQARNVTVQFRERFTLTVTPMGSGSGTITGGGINCPGTCSVSVFDGTAITLTEAPSSAAAGSQNVFSGWGGECSGTQTTCNVTVDAAKTVTASFTLQHRLTVTIAGTGAGSVTGPGGFVCASGTCNRYYDTGTVAALTPMAGASSSFESFSGDCSGATCSPTMSAPRSATASFRLWDCTPDAIVCNDTTDVYTECSPTGLVEFEMDCPLGCANGVEKCLDVAPSNGLASYLDMAPDGPSVAFAGNSTINTTTGAVFNGASDITATTPSETFGGIRVFWFSDLSIAGTLKVSGTAPLALVVDGNVTITGTLDVSADAATSGPGAQSGVCVGESTDSQVPAPGAGGSGRYQLGFPGGNSGTTPGGAGGATSPSSTIEPLVGGCRGGTATGRSGVAVYNASGGGGGGAVQIVSRGTVSVTGSGVIDASAGGGRGGYIAGVGTASSGGGGGSGGSILVEAPQVVIDGSSVVLSTKGGAGGGVGQGAHGQDGGTGPGTASGGVNGSNPAGGRGGNESTFPSAGENGGVGVSGAGGGGGVGETLLNTTSGSVNPVNGATIRSHSQVGTIGTRLVP